MKNRKGLSAVIIVVIVLLIAAIAWSFMRDKPSTSESTDNQAANESTSQAKTSQSGSYSYKLPADWSEMDCAQETTLASPNNDRAVNCEDRTNSVLIVNTAGKKACLTGAEVTEIRKSKPVDSYVCDEMTVSNTKVLKENIKSSGTVTITYTYLGATPLTINYYADEKNALPNAEAVEGMAKSVTFN